MRSCQRRPNPTRLPLLLLLAVLARPLHADQLNVPAQYPTIQAAIDQADHGDTIVVDPCTYYENINFLGLAITVTSVDPDDPCIVAATIIDGSAYSDPNNASVVTFNHGETNDSILQGFTITGGQGTWLVVSWDLQEPYWNRCGGGIVCYNMSEPTITKNVVRNNRAGQGGGLYVYGDPVDIHTPQNPPVHLAPVITDNLFHNNQGVVAHGFAPP